MRHPHRITITITTENAAFDDHEHGEISRILRTACRDMSHNVARFSHWPLLDINGNTCGRFEIVRDD